MINLLFGNLVWWAWMIYLFIGAATAFVLVFNPAKDILSRQQRDRINVLDRDLYYRTYALIFILYVLAFIAITCFWFPLTLIGVGASFAKCVFKKKDNNHDCKKGKQP